MCKGDRLAVETIAADRENLGTTYLAAEQAIRDGERSATRWTKIARTQLNRLDELLAIFNDPLIEEGSPIEISGTDFSHEKTLVEEKAQAANVRLLDRKAVKIEYGSDLLECLDELRKPRNV